MQRQFLILDADDTLWENNIYFETAFDQFCDYLGILRCRRRRFAEYWMRSRRNAKIHGYGCRNFARNLGECLRRLAERDIGDADLEAVRGVRARDSREADRVHGRSRGDGGGVSERHDLTVFTKGDPEEQRLKIERSGLARYFEHTAIVKEKDQAAYDQLAAARGFFRSEPG